MFVIRAEPTTSALILPVATPTTASGPSAHTVLVRSIVVGVVAVVLGLCVCGWIIYMLHGWWAIRGEALRPRSAAEREPTAFDIESNESSEESTDDTHVQR